MSDDAVSGYLSPFNTTLDGKIQHLYEERFLLYARTVFKDNNYYVLGCCAAEMKKNVSYVVDVVVDHHGAVKECQCECAVGTGPDAHCKHVQCLLYGLVQFGSKNEILTRQTCTQRLQTFHKCKKYKGSPMKVSQLSLRAEGSGRELKRHLDYDPRPQKYVKMSSYQSFFDNLCINHQASCDVQGEKPMAILQSLPPANMYGVINDHDYLEVGPEEGFLEKLLVAKISSEQAKAIEESTRGQSQNRLWYAERCKRLTASKFGKICRCTNLTDKIALAKNLACVKKVTSPAIRHGLTFESVAVKKFEEETSVTTKPCGIFVSQTHPFLSGTPDAVVDERTVVEVKCPLKGCDMIIHPATVPYLQYNNGALTLDENHEYYYQVQGQMFCSGRQECKFVVYTFKDLKILTIKRDEKFISTMLGQLNDFYKTYFRGTLLQKYLYRNTDKYTFC